MEGTEKCLFCLHCDDNDGCMLMDEGFTELNRETCDRFEPFDMMLGGDAGDVQDDKPESSGEPAAEVPEPEPEADPVESVLPEPGPLGIPDTVSVNVSEPPETYVRYMPERDSISYPGGLLYELLRDSAVAVLLWPIVKLDRLVFRCFHKGKR